MSCELEKMEYESTSLPFTYLGVAVGANMKGVKNWVPGIDKFKAILFKWKVKSLSFGGRLTLVNSVLNSLTLRYFSLFKAPIKVINVLDNLRMRFLWGGDDDKRKINWVVWDVVTKPKAVGGLSVSFLESMNLAFLAKW